MSYPDETEKDRQNEEEVKVIVEQVRNCILVKIPDNYFVDFMMLRGESKAAQGWVEVKCRDDITSDHYPFAVIPVKKWRYGRGLFRDSGKPFIVVQRFKDGIFYTDESRTTRTIIPFLTEDRDRPEPHICIPVKDLRKLV